MGRRCGWSRFRRPSLSAPRQRFRHSIWLTFALLGPPVGLVFNWSQELAELVVQQQFAAVSVHLKPSLPFAGALLALAYVGGLLPALITGLFAAVFAARTSSRLRFILSCGLIGAVTSTIEGLIVLALMAYPRSVLAVTPHLMSAMVDAAGAGAAAALVCAWLWRGSVRPLAPKPPAAAA